MYQELGQRDKKYLGGATRGPAGTSRAFAGSRKKGDLRYAPLHSRMLCRNYVVQQISPCFLQDLQSEWKKEQMQKSYKGVKVAPCCEDNLPKLFKLFNVLKVFKVCKVFKLFKVFQLLKLFNLFTSFKLFKLFKCWYATSVRDAS